MVCFFKNLFFAGGFVSASGVSTLPARTRDVAFELALRQGLLQPPPPETMFLHRKLAGSYFMLARRGARDDARALVTPFVTGGQT